MRGGLGVGLGLVVFGEASLEVKVLGEEGEVIVVMVVVDMVMYIKWLYLVLVLVCMEGRWFM